MDNISPAQTITSSCVQQPPEPALVAESSAVYRQAPGGIDLNEQLVRNKADTFFMRVSGASMINAGIFEHDIVIVDRSIDPANGRIVIASLDGEMLIRRYERYRNSIRLVPETAGLSAVDVSERDNFKVWGVVTCVIRVIEKEGAKL